MKKPLDIVRVLVTLAIVLFVVATPSFGCASPEDVGPIADAAARSGGGSTDSETGSKKIDLAAQVSQTGDQTADNRSLETQRNSSNTAAPTTYTIGTVVTGGSGAALRKAIDEDEIVKSIREQIAELSAAAEGAETQPTAEIAALRSELHARIRELTQIETARSSAPVTITGNTMIVISPSAQGRDPGATDDGTTKLAEGAARIAAGIMGVEPPETSATSKPSNSSASNEN